MSLSREDNDISRPAVLDHVTDRFFPVRDLHIGTAGGCDPGDDIFYDIHRLLETRIIRSDDSEIRQSPADLSHLEAAGPGAVSSAAKYTDEASRLIFPQSPEQALQSHSVVGIIDHQGEVVAHLDHLDPAPDMDLSESAADRVLRHIKVPADRYGAQGIIDTEFAGSRHMGMEREKPLCIKCDAQFAGGVDQTDVFRPQVTVFPQAEGLHRTSVALQDLFEVRVVPVEDPGPALTEQPALAMEVVLKILVLIGSDMVRGKIGKDPQIKDKAARPVEHEGLGRDLHDNCLHTAVRHIPEGFLKDNRLGSRILSRDTDLSLRRRIQGLDGSHKACPDSGRLQDRAHHIGRGGLALSSRDADDLHLFRRITVKGSAHHSHRFPGVLHPDDGRKPPSDDFRCFRRKIRHLLDDQGGCSFFNCPSYIVMPVTDRSFYTEKQ